LDPYYIAPFTESSGKDKKTVLFVLSAVQPTGIMLRSATIVYHSFLPCEKSTDDTRYFHLISNPSCTQTTSQLVIRGLKLHTEDESVLVNGGVAWQVTPLHFHSIKIIMNLKIMMCWSGRVLMLIH